MQICIVFVLSAYICIVSVDPDIKIRRVGIPLTGLTPPYSHDYPKAGSGFPTQYVAVCVYSIGTSWDASWLLAFMILVELLSIIVYS
jgi:hypothetical protein